MYFIFRGKELIHKFIFFILPLAKSSLPEVNDNLWVMNKFYEAKIKIILIPNQTMNQDSSPKFT